MGIDQDLFLSPVNKNLICAICLNVYENPIYLPLCRHVFCSTCISTWWDQARSSIDGRNGNSVLCPIDKKKINLTKEILMKKKVSYALINIINDSILMCKNHLNGCKDVFTLSAYYDHIKKCPFKSDNEDEEQTNSNQTNDNQAASESVNNLNQPTPSGSKEVKPLTDQQEPLIDVKVQNVLNKEKIKKKPFFKDELTFCKLKHPIKNNESIYSHPNWSKVESNNQQLIKIDFTDLHLYYKPYTLATYFKNIIHCDVYCIHTQSTFPANLKKTLSVYCKESDCDQIMKTELWPNRVTLTAFLPRNKTIIVKGSLKTLRSNFYDFRDKSIEKKELRKKRKNENDSRENSKKKKRNRNRNKRKRDANNSEANVDELKNKKSA